MPTYMFIVLCLGVLSLISILVAYSNILAAAPASRKRSFLPVMPTRKLHIVVPSVHRPLEPDHPALLLETVASLVAEFKPQADRLNCSPYFADTQIFLFNNNPILAQHTAFAHVQSKLRSPLLQYVLVSDKVGCRRQTLPCMERRFHDPRTYLKKVDSRINTNNQRALTWGKSPQQAADYLNVLLYMYERFDNVADVLLWEDDSTACAGAFCMIHDFTRLVSATHGDENWAHLKMGNGASGILINRAHVLPLIQFAFSHIYVTSIDVSIYKYGNFYQLPYFHATKTLNVHKGVRSAFANWSHPVVSLCEEPLQTQWGAYTKMCLRNQSDFERIHVLCNDDFMF